MNSNLDRNYQNNQEGSMLIALMIFIVVGISVATTATMIVIDATVGVSQQQAGNAAIDVAESGAEIAILSLLRDPAYTGEVLSIGEGTATVSIEGENPYTLHVVGEIYASSRSLEVVVAREEGSWLVQEWYEVE
ncbi:MAG: hypothetical protein WDZ94_01095 [Patescibacteria group bacterium]